METVGLIILVLLVSISPIKSIIMERKANLISEYYTYDVIALIFLVAFLGVAIAKINSKEEVYTSKELIFPEIKVEQEKLDFKIIKSDTTYIYIFKKE